MAEEKMKEVKEVAPEKQLEEMESIVEAKEKAKDEKVSKEFDEKAKTQEGRGEWKRESREDRFAREAQTKLDNWSPKTELGRAVRAGKISNIDEILKMGQKIMEPEIVDLLIPGLNVDTLFIGQAKVSLAAARD